MYSEAKWFLITLSSSTPMPVSSTAMRARGMRASAAARAACAEDHVHLLLGIVGEAPLGGLHQGHEGVQFLDGGDGHAPLPAGRGTDPI